MIILDAFGGDLDDAFFGMEIGPRSVELRPHRGGIHLLCSRDNRDMRQANPATPMQIFDALRWCLGDGPHPLQGENRQAPAKTT